MSDEHLDEAQPVEKTLATPNEGEALIKEIKGELVSQITTEVVEKAAKDLKTRFSYKSIKEPAVAKSHEDDGSFGEWLSCVYSISSNRTDREAKEKAWDLMANKYGQKSTLNQGTTTAGGFTVPVRYSPELLRLDDYELVALQRVHQFDIPGMSAFDIPVLDQTGTPSTGNDAFLGGVSVGNVSEGSAPAANTQPAFKQLSLTYGKILASAQITLELMQNSMIAVGDIMAGLFREAIANQIEYNIWNGGLTGFTGIIGSGVQIAQGRNTANSFKLHDAARMYKRLTPRSKQRAVWVMHPYLLDTLLELADSSGRVVWMANGSGYPNVQDAPTLRLFGLPVYTSQYLPAVGTTGDCMLVDLNSYALAFNQQIVIDTSDQFAFTSQLITFRASARVGGKPKYTAPVVLSDGSSTVSPVIALSSTISS